MWNDVKLVMKFTTALCGGLPRDEEFVTRHAERRTATESQHRKLTQEAEENGRPPPQSMTAVVGERVATVDPIRDPLKRRLAEAEMEPSPDEEVKKIWVGFAKDDTGLFVPGRNIRAHLKDLAGVIAKPMKTESIPDVKGIFNFRVKFVDSVYVKEDRVYIQSNKGSVITKASGFRDATLSVMTMRGPRTCLKRVDYIDDCQIVCTVQMLAYSEIKLKHLELCLEYGGVHGFGQDRSLQFGRYEATVEAMG